jgi:hypothetical protein
MRGTAGSLGFPDIAALTAALDDDLKRLVEQDRISAAQLHVSKALFVELRRIASQGKPTKVAVARCRSFYPGKGGRFYRAPAYPHIAFAGSVGRQAS